MRIKCHTCLCRTCLKTCCDRKSCTGKKEVCENYRAHRTSKDAAGYILLSIKQNLSYDALEKLWARGEVDRIPCSRTGFYYTKKYFYHLFDLEVRRIGK